MIRTYKRIKIRLYPTCKQKRMLDSHFDGYRFSYNLCLEYKSFMWNNYKISVSGYDMQAELFEIRKNTQWLRACKAECIRQAALNVDKTYKRFFKSGGYPKFKSKKGKQSFFAFQNISVIGDKIKFFNNKIKYSTSDSYIDILEGNHISNIVFKRDSSGDYWASCLIQSDANEVHLPCGGSVGIDLGLSALITTSNGDKYPNNRYLQNTAFKITKLQRRFYRTKKGSNNRNKLRIKIAKLYRKATRQREHYYHQITNEIIRDNQTIVIETLRVKNMIKNGNLARSIGDVSWGVLTRQLEYKAILNGRNIIKIDSFYPSTKTCSNCGRIKDMPLSERVYNCECGLCLDRDVNAAINIRNSGLKIPGVPVDGVLYPVEAGSNSLILTI